MQFVDWTACANVGNDAEKKSSACDLMIYDDIWGVAK
jgi:hypothetical protein